jgi:hypothetical protein
MPCNFSVMVTQHPLDGLLLALQSGPDVVVHCAPGGFVAAAVGQVLPPTHPGLLGWLTGSQSMNLVGRVPVVFVGHTLGAPLAEILDRLRAKVSGQTLRLVVSYDRLEADMPILTDQDSLRCYWEIRDLLDDRGLERFAYLARRVQAERPTFLPLQFYARQSEGQKLWNPRFESLRETCALPMEEQLVQLQEVP